MVTRIERFSIHQNGKVFGLLMAVSSLVFVIPFMLVMSFTMPAGQGMPLFMFLLFPILYLVFGYLFVAVGCWIYNAMVKYTGGIEFTAKAVAGD